MTGCCNWLEQGGGVNNSWLCSTTVTLVSLTVLSENRVGQCPIGMFKIFKNLSDKSPK